MIIRAICIRRAFSDWSKQVSEEIIGAVKVVVIPSRALISNRPSELPQKGPVSKTQAQLPVVALGALVPCR